MIDAKHYRNLIEEISGENADRPGLAKTPDRAAKALQDLTVGYNQDIDKIVNGAIFNVDDENIFQPGKSDELIIVREIEFYSLCEHHILPFMGHVHIGYIPNDKVIGLSKIPRIVDLFARRLQIQERLTCQIADCLQELLKPKGVGVITKASHMCMNMRGVSKQDPSMVTSALTGVLKTSNEARSEFVSLVKGV